MMKEHNISPEGLEVLQVAGRAHKGEKRTGKALENLQAGALKRRGMKYNVTPEGLEGRRAVGRAKRGKKLNISPEGREARRTAGRASGLANKGRKQSPETRARRSASMVKTISEGRFHPEHYGINGDFYSVKNQRLLHYRSQLELRHYEKLEEDDRVEGFRAESFHIPYTWEGSIHRYLPDLLVQYTDKSIELIEIKPENDRHDSRNRAKFEAARNWCLRCRREINFKLLGYKELKEG